MPDSPSAPAQSPDPTTAVSQAGAAGDFAAYDAARRAELLGKPLAPAPAQPVADEGDDDEQPAPLSGSPQPAAPARPVSKRQQQINDYERKLAEANERIARLEAGTAPRRESPQQQQQQAAPAPAPERFPDYATYLASHPDDSLEQWMDARDEWREQQREQRTRVQAEVQTRTQVQQERVATFTQQIEARTKAEPTWLKAISPDVLALRPFSALAEGERGGPQNVIAEQLIDSPSAPALMQLFTDRPEELARLSAVPDHLQRLQGAALASAHARWIVREMALLEAPLAQKAGPASPIPKTLTSAPDPAYRLGKRATTDADPEVAAVAKDDFTAFEQARRAKLIAARARP